MKALRRALGYLLKPYWSLALIAFVSLNLSDCSEFGRTALDSASHRQRH